MKNIKKIAITAMVFTGLLFAGNQVMALEKNQNSLMQKITAMTQIMELTQEYPQLKELLQPVLDRMVADLILEINKGTTVKENNIKKTEAKKTTPKKQTATKVIKNIKEKKTNYINSASELLSVTVMPYENIQGKWEVKVRFDNKAQVKMYVYDIDSMDELAMAIAQKIDAEFGIEVSEDTIESILKIEDKDDDSDDEEDEEELEIEVEIEDGIAEIEVEIDGEEYEFTLTETDRDLIMEYIADKFNLSVSDVEDVVEFE